MMILLAMSTYHWLIFAQNLWQSFALAFVLVLLVLDYRERRR